MKKVLHIISSTRGDESLTRKLGNAVIAKLKANNPNIEVKELDLSKNSFPHLAQEQISSFFTPAENRTSEQLLAIRKSDDAISEIQEADIIVLGVAMYNFSITSSLKAYFDHIARSRVTFRYTENGSEGLLKNKKAYVAVSTASIFDNDKMRPYDFVTPYVRHFLWFIGITDVTLFRAEGTGIPELKETALDKAIESINTHFYNN